MPDPERDRTHPLRGWPLRAWLVVVNGTILLVTVAASVWIAWDNGDRAVDDLAGQIQRRAGAQVESHLQAYLSAPHTVTQLMTDAIELGEVSPENPAAMYAFLHRLIRVFPAVSYLNVAT